MLGLGNTFVKLFNLERNEGKLVTLMILYSAAIGVPRVFTITAAQAYFLEKFDAQSLPYVYLFAAVINILVGTLYLRLEQKLTFSKLLISISVTMIVVEGGLNILVKNIDGRWPALVLAIWNEAEFILLVMLFWALAGRVFDVRQGKRLFALIGTGEILTGIIGGLAIPTIVHQLGTINLLFVSMGGLGASLFIFHILKRAFPEKLEKNRPTEKNTFVEEKPKLPLKRILKDRYILLIFILSSSVILVDYIVANAFFDRVTLQYPDKDSLASFMGLFFAANSFLGLVVGIFFSGRLLSKFGILLGLLSIPITVGLHALPISVIGTLAEPGIIIFWLMVSGRIFFRTCYYTLNKPATTILYQPFSIHQRGKVQGIADSVVGPIATGVAGAILLFLNKVLDFNAVQLCMVLVVITMVWGIAAIFTRQEYTKRLAKALARRTLNIETLSFKDSSSLTIIENALQSPNVHEVIYAIGMLEEGQPDNLDQYFKDLLNHPEPRVRQEVLKRIERLRRESLFDPVSHLLQQEEDPSIKATAIRALAALEDQNVLEVIHLYLESSDQQVQAGAIVGLLRHGGISGVLTAGAKLIKFAESGFSYEKRFAAQVLGEVGIKDFYQPLITLLDDPDLAVRREAVLAAGKIANVRLWPKIIKYLGVQELRNVAMNALVSGGESTVPYLEMAFNEEEQSQDVQIRIVQIIGKLRGKKAIGFLRKNVDFPDEDVRHPLLLALKAYNYQCMSDEIDFFKDMIFSEVEDAAWAIAALNDISDKDFGNLIHNALEREIKQNRERIFLLLSFIYDSQTISRAWQYIKSEASEKRTYALELIDNLIPQELKQVVFPLIEEITMEQRLKRLNTKFPQKLLGVNGRLNEIITRSEQWTTAWAKCCALYIAGKSASLDFYESILSILKDPSRSPLLLETAAWALGRLNPHNLFESLAPLLSHESPQVKEVVQTIIDQVGMPGIPLKNRYARYISQGEMELYEKILYDKNESRIRRARAAEHLGSCRMESAGKILREALNIEDETIRSSVLSALKKGNFQEKIKLIEPLLHILDEEAEDIEQTLYVFDLCLKNDKSLLSDALNIELAYNRKRLLLVFELLSSRKIFEQFSYWLINPSEPPQQIRELLIVLLQELSKQFKKDFNRFQTLFFYSSPQQIMQGWKPEKEYPMQLEDSLARIAFDNSRRVRPWTIVCVIKELVESRRDSDVPFLIQLLKDPDSFVRETAVWAISQLNPNDLHKLAPILEEDNSLQVRNVLKAELSAHFG